MRSSFAERLLLVTALAPIAFSQASGLRAESWDPAAADYAGRRGKTIHVSKAGDGSDGSTWQKAFRSIGAALSAVPDDGGGHRVIVRPDTYVEANLHPSRRGAQGSYNLLIGDFDGRLGSGAAGRIVIDSGDPEKGFKSYDWWGITRAMKKGWTPDYKETFSGMDWDRWIVRNLYATGGDGAWFWDLTDKNGEGFSVIVEDCVGIGRAFGGGLGHPKVRPDEPAVFRRCTFMSLDRWGDAGAMAVGAFNEAPPEHPDVVCEDCTFAAPDNAVQIIFDNKFTRMKLKDCRLIVLNFSQPHGTPSSGVISSRIRDPKQAHIDFEDCALMGFTLFGTCNASTQVDGLGTGAISYAAKGRNTAYVQFQQPTPPVFERLGLWPVDTIRSLAPWTSNTVPPALAAQNRRDKLVALPVDPSGPGHAGNKGRTIYVSKRGDDSDGTSWQRAYRTIQKALLAVPDAKGGHRVAIRPDTYEEANLYPSYRGAPGSYNLLVGDFDGSLGSGASGWTVIDSGCPGVAVRTDPKRPTGNPAWKIIKSDLPETGLKCVDWWGPFRCDPEYSASIWDRWIYRNLYATGSEGGIGWDMTCDKGAEFSAVVESCVGIGRFAGACVMAHVPRKGEPVLFRRSYFMNMDWWGDAGAAYVRGESKTMPEEPHAVFDDCTLVSPDNAIQAGWPGVDELNTRVKLKACRLIVLNFSQPRGTPSSGIICCGCKDGKQLHVDFEDTVMMGYKVFGTRGGEVSYTTKGAVGAYVEFEQPVPARIDRIKLWPVALFDAIQPPAAP
jgi:hypothetical protein